MPFDQRLANTWPCEFPIEKAEEWRTGYVNKPDAHLSTPPAVLALGDGHARHLPRPSRARAPARGVLPQVPPMGGAGSQAADRRRARRLLRDRSQAAMQQVRRARAMAVATAGHETGHCPPRLHLG